MSDIAVAEKFLRDYRNDYNTLLEKVKASCNEVKISFGPGTIDDVYTRGSSQDGNEFKDPGKIANKVRQRGLPVGIPAFLDLNDIVGMTVVVNYPDDISRMISAICKILHKQKIKTSKPEKHENKNGYFATHVVCSGTIGAATLKCEMQFKTMLHDAWGAKMHDLTYKPIGVLDPRLRALMASIASTIENLEEQSRLIRDMIKASWNVEDEARRAARNQLFGTMLVYGNIIWKKSRDPAIVKLHDEVEKSSELLRSAPLNHRGVSKLVDEVDRQCRDPTRLRQAWMVAGRIASLREQPDLTRFFQKQVDAWLELAPGLLANGDIDAREIGAVPLMFYVIGDLDRAIDYSHRLVNDSVFDVLPPAQRLLADFNRISFITEREYHTPTADEATRIKLRKEIESVLTRIMELQETEISSTLDTQGLVKITFAQTKEEVRAGIEDCVRASGYAPAPERDVSQAYMDLNLRLGWRRYFDLELRSRGG